MVDVIRIDDLRLPGLQIYALISEVQLLRHDEPEPGLFIAESPKVIARALDAGYKPLSMLIERKQLEQAMGERRNEKGGWQAERRDCEERQAGNQLGEFMGRCGDIPVVGRTMKGRGLRPCLF